MISKYSLCFQPDEATLELVKQMKLQLADEIGWYNSKNSLAHITISKFKTDLNGIKKIAELVRTQCSTFTPVQVLFNNYGQYPNGAFFLAVDEFSKPILQEYAKKVMRKVVLPEIYKSNEPHMSIARKLDPERLERALVYFQKPAISCLCNHIALRQFNPDRRQYDIIATFPFLGLPSNEPEQLSLF